MSVIPCLSCTVSPNTALDFFRSLLKSTSLAKQVINPESICNRLQVGKLFTWRSLFVLRFFVSVRHNAGTHLLHIHEPKLAMLFVGLDSCKATLIALHELQLNVRHPARLGATSPFVW